MKVLGSGLLVEKEMEATVLLWVRLGRFWLSAEVSKSWIA